ncbi:MAG: nucleoside phosphorylase [Myxococcales bacterium]|nr:nucleoside phosphorylase [Myxococcales bacterium]
MMRSAEEVCDERGRQYHIDLAPGEVAPAIILVGDPKRAERVAGLFDEVELERRNREFVTFTGRHRGLRMTVMGTGMGAGSTEIAVIELCQCVDDPVMIRCGSSGGLQEGMRLGDLVITQGALRMECASLHFVDPGYPAVADPQVILALAQAADEAGERVHLGITATAPGFYGAQGRRVPGFPPKDPEIVDRLAAQGVRNLEMEASTLLTLATFRRFAAGAICAVYATRVDNQFIDTEAKDRAELACITTGLRAQHIVAAMRQRRGERPLWHPGLGL